MNSYSERVLYDRYSIKDPEAVLKAGDIVVVTQQEADPFTRKMRDTRHIGIVRAGNGHGTFDVALKHSAEDDKEREVLTDVPRHLLEYVVEREYEPICRRLADGIVADEPDNEEFKEAVYQATSKMEFIPAGRILAGLGRGQEFDLTLFNCYVFAIPGDSREAIGTHWLRLLNTFATGGGIGWNLSVLRPRGSLVKKVNGRSSGSVSWGEQFSQVTGAVEQGGSRRGASLMGLWCWHPDIEEFIEAKSLYDRAKTREGEWIDVQGKLLTNSNVSVMISDDFMEAVEYNSEWDLVFPDTSHPDYDETWDGDLWQWKREGKPVIVYKTVNARELWNKIVHHAWKSGEPGLLFLERANKMSNSYYYDRISCTNPCVTGDTKIPVWKKGDINTPIEVPIRDLVGQEAVHIWVDDREVVEVDYPYLPHRITAQRLIMDTAQKVIHTGKKPTWRLRLVGTINSSAHTFGAGYSDLHLTEDHKVRTPSGMVAAKDLKAGDQVHVIGGTTATVEVCLPTGEEEDVYDIVNTATHTFIANGIVVSNCGEQPLPKNSVCNLSHLNLARFIKDDAPQFPEKERSAVEAWKMLDVEHLKDVIQIGVRFLDNAVDLNKYHDPATEKQQMKERRIGLGVLGLGELLIRLGLGYGSHEGLKFTNTLFQFISKESYLASVELAKERGNFPAFDAEQFVHSGFMRKHLPEVVEAVKEHGIRNVTLNTVAPTGSVGTLADTTTGIEPYFAFEWTATTRIGTAEEKMSVLETIVDKFGKDQEKWPSYVVTAQRGISTAQHVKMMATAQRWIDASISKTINLPKGSTVEDVSNAYIAMWRHGCKGGTVYVDESRDEQVLHVERAKKEKERPRKDTIVVEVQNEAEELRRLRPPLKSGIGPTYSIESTLGSVHITFRCDPESGEPYDFFINSGKGEVAANAQAIARLISMILRWPNNEEISQKGRLDMIRIQLYKIPGLRQTGMGEEAINSFPDAVSRAMDKFLKGNYPLARVPFGMGPLKEMMKVLQKHDVPAGVLDKLFLDNDNENSEEKAFQQAEEDFAESEDTERYPRDLCPRCGQPNFLRIPGKCPYCVKCGYKEC